VKITNATDVGNIVSFEDFKRTTAPLFDQVRSAINGGIQIENLRAKTFVVIVEAADTDIQLNHNLGVIPVGYYKLQGDSMILYDGGVKSWTTENIFVRASAVGVCTILVMG